MQFTVSINQKAIVGLNKTLDLDLSLKHGSIIDFFVKVKNNDSFQTKIIDGEEYIWLTYDKIIEELPLLKIKSKVVLARYFDDLVKARILKKRLVKEEGNKTYWRQDKNLQCLLFNVEVSTKKLKGINSKVKRVSTKKFNNHITTDHNTNQREEPPQKNENKNENKNQEVLDSFLNVPFYREHKLTRFPNLTDQEIKLKILSFTLDRPYTKFELMMTVLAEENTRKLKSQKTKEWYGDKKDFYKYQNNPVGRVLPDTNNQNSNIETFSWSLTGGTFVNHLKRKVFIDPFDFDYNTEKINEFLKKYKKDNYIIS